MCPLMTKKIFDLFDDDFKCVRFCNALHANLQFHLPIYPSLLHLYWGVRPVTSVLDKTLNNLMVIFQFSSSGECGVNLNFHYFQICSDLEWQYLLESHLLVKWNCSIIYYTWNHLTVCKQMSSSSFWKMLPIKLFT